MKLLNASISDVETALEAFRAAVQADAVLESKSGKKLAAVVELLEIKDGVTKDLKQAFNHGESWWAKNVLNNNHENCTKDNKLEKIKLHVLRSPAYIRHTADDATKAKVAKWLADKFPAPADVQIDEAA